MISLQLSTSRCFSVDEVMETELAKKFYKEWREGRVMCRLIGQRFGYGVLGRFLRRGILTMEFSTMCRWTTLILAQNS